MNFRTYSPFGTNLKRFQGTGLHPNLDKTGCYTNKSKLGPGEYNIEHSECAYKNYLVAGSKWKREADCKEFSENLGFRNTHLIRERKFRESFGGPGCYDISEETFMHKTFSCKENIGFGCQKRFHTVQQFNKPPPGTYNRNLLEQTIITHKQFTSLPPFEWDGFIDRFKSSDKPWSKASNLYNPKYPGTIQALLSKQVSKRGPYDLFTGPRDDTTIKNKFSPAAFKGPLNWFNVYPNELEILLKHPNKRRCGRFFKDKRFGRATQRHMIDDPTQVYHDPNDPDPCSYTIDKKKEIVINKYAFNASVKHVRPCMQWMVHPGVGRYSPKYSKRKQLKKESWVFKSKIGRPENKGVEYNAF